MKFFTEKNALLYHWQTLSLISRITTGFYGRLLTGKYQVVSVILLCSYFSKDIFFSFSQFFNNRTRPV